MPRWTKVLGLFIALAVTPFLALVAYRSFEDFQKTAREKKRHQAYVAEIMRRLTVENEKCIAYVALSNPKIDVEQDLARGDSTPIGISYTPHDPPTTETHYPGAPACKDVVKLGHYEKTGKSFTRTDFVFMLFDEPVNEGKCNFAATRYAEAYNKWLSQLAPSAVKRFCSQLQVADRNRL